MTVTFDLYKMPYQTKQFVRHIAEWQVERAWRYQHRTTMAECFERFAFMVSPHSRVAHTAKRHIGVDNVHHAVVYAGATR